MEKALRGIVHPLGVEEMVSEMGVFSQVRVYMGDRYGLGLMAFYVFTCLVLGIMLSMNFGTSQRAFTFLDNYIEKLLTEEEFTDRWF